MRSFLNYQEKLTKQSRKLRTSSTFPEILLWSKLRRKQIDRVRFLRQRPIHNFIVDFYAPEIKLIIEIDGKSHDDTGAYDLRREEQLRKLGLHIFRVQNDEILKNLDNVVEQIYELTLTLK